MVCKYELPNSYIFIKCINIPQSCIAIAFLTIAVFLWGGEGFTFVHLVHTS
jgi:hypothetical protein